MNNIHGQVALVTGGASGIGRLVALLLAARGARVIIWDLNPEGLKAIEDEGRKLGYSITGMVCDVSDRAAVYRQAAAAAAAVGPVDILVNNAGIVSGGA